MTIKQTDTFWAKIYIAGPIAGIEQCCRDYCQKGLCVTVTPTNYIYTGGEQTGAIIGLINYARFPMTEEFIEESMIELGGKIMISLHQLSFSVETPKDTRYFEREDIGKKKE